jgi:hypothetical protein
LRDLCGWLRLSAQKNSALFLGAVETLLDRLDVRLSLDEQADWERLLASARAQLDAATFTRAWNTGRSMTPEQAGSSNGHRVSVRLTARPLPAPP